MAGNAAITIDGSRRRRFRIRKEVMFAGEDWPDDPGAGWSVAGSWAYQACSCSPHDLLAAQQMPPSFFPTPVSSTGDCSGFWSIMDPEWIEEDSIMQMLLSQLSHGGYRSMFGQDAVFPETAGLSPYPGMQAQGGRGQPGQMPFGRRFEVGESSKSRPKRKRQDEANTEWIPPPQRARLDRSQGILGGHGLSTRYQYRVYDAVFQGMNLPADPHLRAYMYYIGRVKGKAQMIS